MRHKAARTLQRLQRHGGLARVGKLGKAEHVRARLDVRRLLEHEAQRVEARVLAEDVAHLALGHVQRQALALADRRAEGNGSENKDINKVKKIKKNKKGINK